MYDRQTFSLWGNLTGEPVVGKFATSGQRLRMLPMTLTTWGEWRGKHPKTTVLHLEDEFGKKWNYRYEPGLADRARSGVQFPVWQKSKALKDKEEVYGIRLNTFAKAYPIKTLLSKRLLNDTIGDTGVLLVVDPQSQSVRAYHRNRHTFTPDLKDESGRSWSLQEHALISGADQLPRIPGYVSFWFAWFGFFPHTELYR